ncbi:MAG: aspartate aminotransferase family protein [Desulfovibrio sp.]|nr:aspartate aminotransferase family protein [Desulfovibrio sp.]
MSQKFSRVKEEESQLLCRSYNRYPLAIARGKMSRLWDVDGKEYVDLLAGIAVTALGHCHDEIVETLTSQAKKLWHVSNLFYQEEQLTLAREILSTTHHTKAFFCNSGAEANEAAIKLARRYMAKVKKRQASEIITLEGCFHGRTLGTLAATGRESLSDGFGPLPKGFLQVPLNDMTSLENAMTEKTAAVLVEVVQGEGGIIPLSGEYLRGIEELCRKKDVLFMCDEVQAGFCRTGKFWAFQLYDLHPDIMSTAKALANGLPMGAMLATDTVAQGFDLGSHATTFGGGALTSAVAAKVIEIMKRDHLAERAERLGAGLKKKLNALRTKHPGKIQDIRLVGLMVGIEIGEKCPEIWTGLLEKGFICGLSHNATLRLLPALTIEEQDLDAFVEALDALLALQ